MISSVWFALFWFFFFEIGVQCEVCIVGSGIAGSGAAYFLHKLDPTIEISVFEKRSTIGGRTKTTTFEGLERPVDLGASIVHKDNRYMIQFAKELNINIQETPKSSWGIYNGKSFVFESGASETVDMGKFFMMYGFDLNRMRDVVTRTKKKFDQIYDFQSKGETFASPIDLLKRLDLYALTQTSLEEMMLKNKIRPPIINELMAAVNRVNYGQNCTLSALAGFVGLMGAGSDIRVFQGGFQQVSEGLLKLSKARVTVNVTIKEIVKEDKGFVLKTDSIEAQKCNAVIIAALLEQSSLELPTTSAKTISRAFWLTQTTFVKGTIKASYFHDKKSVPSAIYTTEAREIRFNSIGCYTPENQTNATYKIFSRAELSEDEIEKIFENPIVLRSIPWRAYPSFKSPEIFSPFVLEPGLVYINTIESAASAMEISAIGAKNAALLVHKWISMDHKETDSVTTLHGEL